MSCGVRVIGICSLHSLTTHPYPTHIWIATRVIDPHHFRTTYIYRTHRRRMQGVKIGDVNSQKKNYGTICISWYPKYISVTQDRNLITMVPNTPMPFILATKTYMDITRDHTIDIIFTVSMLLLFSSQGWTRTSIRLCTWFVSIYPSTLCMSTIPPPDYVFTFPSQIHMPQ